MDFSLRELECFTAVAEELSFTRAAQKLHLAQPPLSRHVRALEERLGTLLFDRSGRKVSLTAAGAVFYEETRTVMPQLIRARETTRRFASGQTERLRLGFVSAVLSPELVEVLRAFREKHPQVQLLMQDLPPAEQLKALQRGSLDGGFIGRPPGEHTRNSDTAMARGSTGGFCAFRPSARDSATNRSTRVGERGAGGRVQRGGTRLFCLFAHSLRPSGISPTHRA